MDVKKETERKKWETKQRWSARSVLIIGPIGAVASPPTFPSNEARNTNDDNWQQHDNTERTGSRPAGQKRVRQRVSFIQAANFTRADTCAFHSSHCKPGFMPFRRHSTLYFTRLHFLLREI